MHVILFPCRTHKVKEWKIRRKKRSTKYKKIKELPFGLDDQVNSNSM